MNCGAALHGRFCHTCGQENIEPKESFWHLLTHFVYDLVHFDGKFFSTLKYLLFKPGFLSYEHLRGRRADYLHPIRLYVFTSAFFFLIFFSFYQKDEEVNLNQPKKTQVETILKQLKNQEKELNAAIKYAPTEVVKNNIDIRLAETKADILMIEADSTKIDSVKSINHAAELLSLNSDSILIFGKNEREYDSIQKLLPIDSRDGFFKRRIAKQSFHLNEKYKGNKSAMMTAVKNKFKHLFPQMLFVSLPLFALFLRLLYIRRKQFYYVNHVIYSIHLYCALFIIILIGLWLGSLSDYFHKEYIKDLLGLVFTLAGFFYMYKSMRNFYAQRRAKTILKYILVLLGCLFLMILIFIFFMLFSAMII